MHVPLKSLMESTLGVKHLSQPRLEQLAQQLHRHEQVLNYHPSTDQPHRTLVVLRRHHPMAPLVAAAYAASRVTEDGITSLPRPLIEERLSTSLHQVEAGRRLAQVGLLLMGIQDDRVQLKGTNPLLAQIVNRLRYGGSRRGRDNYRLVQAALGKPQRPRRLHEATVWQAVQAYDALVVDALGLCDMGRRSHPRSRWLMSEVLHPVPQEA